MITNNYKKIIFTLLVPAAFFGMSNSGNVFSYKNCDKRFFSNDKRTEKEIEICYEFEKINNFLSLFATKPPREIVSKKQDLTFEVLKDILKKESYDENFKYLKTNDGHYNVLEYLASDNFLYVVGEEGISKKELVEKIINFNEKTTLSKKQDLTFEISLDYLKKTGKEDDCERFLNVLNELKYEGKYILIEFFASDQFLIEILGKENLKYFVN